jgi:hypothetical protein
MEVKIQIDGIDVLNKTFNEITKQMPFAIMLALNKTAKEIWEAEKAEMQRAFDRPTPYTGASIRYRQATKTSLRASVDHFDFGKGTPPRKYLEPQILGGDRNLKRSEVALRTFGILPNGMFTVPGSAAKIDAYGNMDPGQIRQILSYFQSAEMYAGYTSNMTARTKARLAKGSKKKGTRGYEYFVASRSNSRTQHLAPGIYQRFSFGSMGSSIKPVLMFVKRPRYSKRYNFYDVARKIIDQQWEKNLKEAWRKAIETAK